MSEQTTATRTATCDLCRSTTHKTPAELRTLAGQWSDAINMACSSSYVAHCARMSRFCEQHAAWVEGRTTELQLEAPALAAAVAPAPEVAESADRPSVATPAAQAEVLGAEYEAWLDTLPAARVLTAESEQPAPKGAGEATRTPEERRAALVVQLAPTQRRWWAYAEVETRAFNRYIAIESLNSPTLANERARWQLARRATDRAKRRADAVLAEWLALERAAAREAGKVVALPLPAAPDDEPPATAAERIPLALAA